MTTSRLTSLTSLTRLLDVIEHDIVPLTRQGVRRGDKVFGAAILRKESLELVVAGTNAETENPLWHGEMSAIKNLYELPESDRPPPSDCLFLSTHEPCSMCLSAITWAGYDNIFYLFSYEQTRDRFEIPYDLRILDEVFGCQDGGYAEKNAFWESHSIERMLASLSPSERAPLRARVAGFHRTYDELSSAYRVARSTSTEIPLP